MSELDLQALSPRRKYLLEFEKALDIQIPATRKKRKGDNQSWKKSTPGVTNEDLRTILEALLEELGKDPEICLHLDA